LSCPKFAGWWWNVARLLWSMNFVNNSLLLQRCYTTLILIFICVTAFSGSQGPFRRMVSGKVDQRKNNYWFQACWCKFKLSHSFIFSIVTFILIALWKIHRRAWRSSALAEMPTRSRWWRLCPTSSTSFKWTSLIIKNKKGELTAINIGNAGTM
jgi:hypothetical protein